MSKAFKFTDNNYLDSTGVVHQRTPLNQVLEEIKEDIGDPVPINSIFDYDGDTVPDGYERVSSKLTELFNGSKGASGTSQVVTILNVADLYEYDFLIIEVGNGNAATERKISLLKPVYGTNAGVTDLLYALNGYRASYELTCNGYGLLNFQVREVTGWTASSVLVKRVWGLKL